MNKPELLAPAGSFEKAKTAFLYGADAVYMGTSKLSLRSRVEVDDDELIKTIKYAHSIEKKLYVALNIYASGTLQYSVKYASASKDSLKLSLSGKLIPIAELANSPDFIIKMSVDSDGTLIDASGDATVTKNGITRGFKFYGTIVNIWIKTGAFPTMKQKCKLFDAW